MEFSRFERLTWRVNGILIFLCSIIAFCLMLVVGYNLLRDIFRTRSATSIVNVNPETKESESLKLSGFRRIPGTDLLSAALIASQEYQQSFYSKSGTSTRNYLFLDIRTKATNWLLNGNGSLVVSERELYADPTADSQKRKVSAFLFEIVKRDSNSDSRLSGADRLTVVLYSVLTKQAVELLEITGDLLGIEQTSENEALILYRDGLQHIAATLDISAQKILATTTLPTF